MVTRQSGWLQRFSAILTAATLVLATARPSSAQEEQPSSAVGDVVKGVIFDPTTYAPAIISYDAAMRDWTTSQPFFRNGYHERNPRFTVSGRPNGTPLSYEAGNRQILRDSLTTLGLSAIHNLTSRAVERALLEQHPERRKLVKTIGWIQRIAVGTLMSYHLSAAHYRQASLNAKHARELGLR